MFGQTSFYFTSAVGDYEDQQIRVSVFMGFVDDLRTFQNV